MLKLVLTKLFKIKIMKNILLIFAFFLMNYSFGQGMKITWKDQKGREFSINTQTRQFEYSMIQGDNIYYNNAYSGGPDGSVKSIGNVNIYYNNAYSGGPDGSVKSVGNVNIYYNNAYSGGPDGSVKSVGNMKIFYNVDGKIKSTIGSVY
jgi:hypothetical protein